MLHPDTPAPEFTLPDAQGKAVSLHDCRGRTVVLVFYPKDHSPVCSMQLNEYARKYGEFVKHGAEILAVSTDPVDTHATFHAKCLFPFPILSDADRTVCRAYDVLSLLGMAQRAVYVIDGDGMIRFAAKAFPIGYLRAEALLKELAS
jgi:thioredoxin-dependent peroxiredoxin